MRAWYMELVDDLIKNKKTKGKEGIGREEFVLLVTNKEYLTKYLRILGYTDEQIKEELAMQRTIEKEVQRYIDNPHLLDD